MNIHEISKFIFVLRKTKKKVITNYYLTLKDSKEDFETWTSENSIVFCAQENKVLRCFFATTDLSELNTLLEKMPKDTVLDYITREKTERFCWTDAGFELYRTLIRYTNPNLSAPKEKTKREKFLEPFYQEDFGEFASEDDAEELYCLLYKAFDYRVSRLPSREELSEQIKKNWVLLYRYNGEIIAFLIYQIEGKKYYGYQIYNEGTADIAYNLDRRALQYAISAYQVKSSYAWVEMNNSAAKKRAGGNFDGTYDFIFLKTERGKCP